jgi:hypothetical protein
LGALGGLLCERVERLVPCQKKRQLFVTLSAIKKIFTIVNGQKAC